MCAYQYVYDETYLNGFVFIGFYGIDFVVGTGDGFVTCTLLLDTSPKCKYISEEDSASKTNRTSVAFIIYYTSSKTH